MNKKCNISILSSKRLTKSFKRVGNHRAWESIGLTEFEAHKIIKGAIKKMNKNSDPLTITVTVNS